MSKVEQVNQILSDKGISSSWRVRTEREALTFVVDVIETESVLGDDKWEACIQEFAKYVLSYTNFMDELAHEDGGWQHPHEASYYDCD